MIPTIFASRFGKFREYLTRRHPRKASINAGLFLYSFQCNNTGTWFLTAILHSVAYLAAIIGVRGLMLPSGIMMGCLPEC
jgi:hypothetical protein